jgi:ABC-2 type transport system ATP-binding protein
MSEFLIETHDLRRQYKNVRAVDGLNLGVPQGSLCGFLGRNGAGKTTTIKMLLGMTRPDAGEGSIFGYPIDTEAGSIEIRRRTGYVSETKELYPFMSVSEVIRFTRSFYPGWRRDLEEKYLKLFGLPLDRPIPKLSKGMRTQLMLLLALARAPELLILDEPTEGLDPVMIEVALEALVGIAGDLGTTVFFSSHQLGEVEQIADRICIIHAGRAVISGDLDDVKSRYKRIQFALDRAASEAELAVGPEARLHREGRTVAICTGEDSAAIVERARSIGACAIEVFPMSLKEIFLEYAR